MILAGVPPTEEQNPEDIADFLPKTPNHDEYYVVGSSIPVGPRQLQAAELLGWKFVTIIPFEAGYLTYFQYKRYS